MKKIMLGLLIIPLAIACSKEEFKENTHVEGSPSQVTSKTAHPTITITDTEICCTERCSLPNTTGTSYVIDVDLNTKASFTQASAYVIGIRPAGSAGPYTYAAGSSSSTFPCEFRLNYLLPPGCYDVLMVYDLFGHLGPGSQMTESVFDDSFTYCCE